MDKKITNIKERILFLSEYKGVSKESFFDKIGMTYGSFKGKQKETALNSDAIDRILSIYNDIDANWLLTGKGEMLKSKVIKAVEKENNELDTDYIPLIPIDAMAGYGTGEVQISKKELLKGYKIPEFQQRGVEYIIRVSGSSMYPKYSSGDLLGCKTVKDLSFFQWGKIYVLDTDQGPMVKRLFPIVDNDEVLECRSDNKDYPPFPINKTSIYNVAIVIGVLRME